MTPSYTDPDGIRHEVTVRRTAAGDWQVLDTSPAETRIIETLDGRQDGQEQAEAVARDYAENVHRLGWIPGRRAAERIPEQGGADVPGDRPPHPDRAQPTREGLRCRVRLPDGRIFAGELPPERHRALQIGLLHDDRPAGWWSWPPV